MTDGGQSQQDARGPIRLLVHPKHTVKMGEFTLLINQKITGALVSSLKVATSGLDSRHSTPVRQDKMSLEFCHTITCASQLSFLLVSQQQILPYC